MKDDGDGDGLAYDSESSSVIKLNNGMVLYLREVNKYVHLSFGLWIIKCLTVDWEQLPRTCVSAAIGELYEAGHHRLQHRLLQVGNLRRVQVAREGQNRQLSSRVTQAEWSKHTKTMEVLSRLEGQSSRHCGTIQDPVAEIKPNRSVHEALLRGQRIHLQSR